MALSLSDPISAYFEFSNGSDTVRIDRCFMQDAVVVDERHTAGTKGVGKAVVGLFRELGAKVLTTLPAVRLDRALLPGMLAQGTGLATCW